MQEYSQNANNSELYSRYDLIIVGAGPAGLTLAYALVDVGFSVCILDSNPEKPWTQSLCFWKRELDDVVSPESFQYLFRSSVQKEWASAGIQLTEAKKHRIDATYAKFDSAYLQSRLKDAIIDRGGCVVEDSVDSIEHSQTCSFVRGKKTYQARAVVVANGSSSRFLTYSDANPAYQIAYGQRLDLPSGLYNVAGRRTKSWNVDCAGFMDFMSPFELTDQFSSPPSFLYTLPLTPNELFLEETILATRSQVDWEQLKNRLELRKVQAGLQNADVIEEEYCKIEMGGGLPEFGRTLAFGAAAGFVHPVTGFQIMRSIRTAPLLAAFLKENWGQSPEGLAHSAWNVIWTPVQRQNRLLYLLGLDILTHLNLDETQSFFDAFFKGARNELSGFLLGSGTTKAVESSMWKTFNSASWKTRRLIIQHSMRHPHTVLASLLGKNRLEAS